MNEEKEERRAFGWLFLSVLLSIGFWVGLFMLIRRILGL